MILRFVKHLLTFLFFVVPLMIAGWFILPIVLLFVRKDEIRLPSLFKWFDSADSYIDRDTSVYKAVCQEGYWARYIWLAFRNPINYVGYKVLGFQFDGTEMYYNYDSKQFDIGDTSREGIRTIELMKNEKIFYEYYIIKKWSQTKCLRIRLGWKIKDNLNPIGSWCQWVFVFQIWKDYSGS